MRVPRRHGWTLVAGLIAAAALGFAGCSDDDDAGSTTPPPPPSTGAPTSTAPAGVTFAVEATADGDAKVLTFPETIEAGVVTMTLTNSDTEPRSAQIIRVEGEQTVDEVLAAVDDEAGGIPDFVQDGGGISTVEPGQTATVVQVLQPGRYVISDDEGGDEESGTPSNSERGAKGEFTVTGEPVTAELPTVPGRITATDENGEDYGFEFAGLTAGDNQVRFENTGDELHHAIMVPISGDATIEQVEEFFTTEGAPTGPPPVDFTGVRSTAVIDGGIAQNVQLSLDVGRYAVVCFISDREAGTPPHVAQGMISELVVE